MPYIYINWKLRKFINDEQLMKHCKGWKMDTIRLFSWACVFFPKKKHDWDFNLKWLGISQYEWCNVVCTQKVVPVAYTCIYIKHEICKHTWICKYLDNLNFCIYILCIQFMQYILLRLAYILSFFWKEEKINLQRKLWCSCLS